MAPSNEIKAIETEEQFTSYLNENKDAVTVVEFGAVWSEGCKQMREVISELAKESEQLTFVTLQAESLPELSMAYEINAVPTYIFIKAGKPFDRLDGVHPGDLTQKVRQYKSGIIPAGIPPKKVHTTAASASSSAAPTSKEDLNARLKALINRQKCMLFMKGNPDEPKCGFSRQTISILSSIGNSDYGTFDILTDEAVRQGLKEYSNWPTFPQLYVDGELVGGLDIIKELVEAGELNDMIPKKVDMTERLKALINQAPVMVFMKGEPSGPKCKFSRALMEILGEEGVKFSHFDILEDNDVREGLKKFSNWPTYPQVYVKGELIGGIDIIKELKEAGELKDTLSE